MLPAVFDVSSLDRSCKRPCQDYNHAQSLGLSHQCPLSYTLLMTVQKMSEKCLRPFVPWHHTDICIRDTNPASQFSLSHPQRKLRINSQFPATSCVMPVCVLSPLRPAGSSFSSSLNAREAGGSVSSPFSSCSLLGYSELTTGLEMP